MTEFEMADRARAQLGDHERNVAGLLRESDALRAAREMRRDGGRHAPPAVGLPQHRPRRQWRGLLRWGF